MKRFYPPGKNFCRLFLPLIVTLLFFGCKEDFNNYYDAPDNLAGPIFEQLENDPDFSEFTMALGKLTTLKRAVNTSGLYTVFAPTNESMRAYYAKIGKSSIDDFDMSVESDSMALYKLVNSHILYNMYFKSNFDNLIDEDEQINQLVYMSNDVYRFGTRYREPDYIVFDKNVETNRKVRPGNKVLSIYTDKYINKYKMASDYEDIYGTAAGDFNVEGVQVLEDKRDIAAKNGVIHGINGVIDIIPTIDRVLAEKNPYFSSLLESFVRLEFQDVEGIDSIFYKDYSSSVNFSSDNNIITLFCPEEGEYNNFVDNKILKNFYNSFDSIPEITAIYLLSSYLVDGRRWLSDIQDGVVNILGDTLTDIDITENIVASNGLIYVTGDLLLSSAFSTVVQVPMTHKEYSWFLELLSQVSRSNFIEILRYVNTDYTFFVPTNEALVNYGVERIVDNKDEEPTFYINGFIMYPRATDTLINNFIVRDEIFDPSEETYKWHQTRSGNFLLVQNGKLNGNIDCIDKVESDNGFTFTLQKIPPRPNMSVSTYLKNFEPDSHFSTIINRWFSDLISEDLTGEVSGDEINYTLSLIDGNNSFTVFVPTDEALQTYKDANGLGGYDTDSSWQDIAQYHIVQTRLFSEGSFERKAENPLPEDDSKFLTLYKDRVYSPDNIFKNDRYAWVRFVDNEQKIVNQSGDEANLVSTYDFQAKNGVVHHVDKVLPPPVREFPDNE